MVNFKIKTRRRARGLTQRELAALVGTTDRTIIRWENRDSLPDEEHRERLARVLGGEPDDYTEPRVEIDGSTDNRVARLEERLKRTEGEMGDLARSLSIALDIVEQMRRGAAEPKPPPSAD